MRKSTMLGTAEEPRPAFRPYFSLPLLPGAGTQKVVEACGKELILLLAASTPALPVCTARAAMALATGLTHTHRLLPSWVDSRSLPFLRPGPGAPIVGTCRLANGALRFGPETGQNERLSEERKEGETV
ncbi:unnamed protein product [Nyctereutes procyonoides]|uniref:(raccoon dog) hypothetical protein n=1 Tax=Nyctereutes procyonoides TaxID=34880 RepID=A0A811Y2A4_NYCPR|nr:unnamed protein product [Nyctereutes procyonoides]